MSAIASAYKLTEAQLSEALVLLDRNEHEEFWKLMRSYEIGTLHYAGYVLAAVIPFVRQKGVVVPDGRMPESLTSGHQKQLGLLAIGNSQDYASIAKGLEQMEATDDELRRFYADLFAHDWEEAPTAMREGFAFIQRGITALDSDDEFLIFSVV